MLNYKNQNTQIVITKEKKTYSKENIIQKQNTVFSKKWRNEGRKTNPILLKIKLSYIT